MKNKYSDYCPNCGHHGYEVEERRIYLFRDFVGNPLPNSPSYISMIPYCPICDTILFKTKLGPENKERRDEALREYYNSISLEDLKKIPKKYGVPRERIEDIFNFDVELRKPTQTSEHRTPYVLGFSAWDGEPLNREVSDELRKGLDSPTYFLKRMDEAKDVLPIEFYERVRPRIETMAKREQRRKEKSEK